MAGGPVGASKKTWAGLERRRRLLAAEGIEVPDDIGSAGAIPADDVLDAAAAAWTARRVARGVAGCLPDPPEVLDGRPCAIWV